MTIDIDGQRAVLADGEWRSSNERLRELLNSHLESVQLEAPGHLPPGDRELAAARAAVEDYQGRIISIRRIPNGPSFMSDGRQIVF